jgi:hypothetical protein
MLEECCNEYRVRVRELEERLHRPEFKRDADIHAEKVENLLPGLQQLLELNVTLDNIIAGRGGPGWGGSSGLSVARYRVEERIEKIYDYSIKTAQLYILSGDLVLAEKFRQIAEKAIHDRDTLKLKIEKYIDYMRRPSGGRKNKSRKIK